MNLTAALWHFQRGQERKAFIGFFIKFEEFVSHMLMCVQTRACFSMT